VLRSESIKRSRASEKHGSHPGKQTLEGTRSARGVHQEDRMDRSNATEVRLPNRCRPTPTTRRIRAPRARTSFVIDGSIAGHETIGSTRLRLSSSASVVISRAGARDCRLSSRSGGGGSAVAGGGSLATDGTATRRKSVCVGISRSGGRPSITGFKIRRPGNCRISC